tara:strand:- start:297 stop:1061 length:765 start_codon:yes stop_codon:yes gene_type:complete
MKILKICNLNINYGKKESLVKAVKDVSLEINKGEIYGLVGESGCGKSTLAKSIVRLLPINSGDIYFNNKLINNIKKTALKAYRKDTQMIFQDPYGSLNPRMQVGEAFLDIMKVHNIFNNKHDRLKRAIDLFNLIGLPSDFLYRYPHEFSGGQRQRICIARALILEPKMIIADEPVSALDVSVQSEILTLILNLRDKYELTFMFISHDLAVVKNICDQVAVMNKGCIVERGIAKNVICSPQHEYTKKLVNAVPKF